MKYQILGPADPALAVIQQQLKNHPEWETELKIVPWAEYEGMMNASLDAETSSYQAVCVPGHIWLPGLVSGGKLSAFDSLLPQIDQKFITAYNADDIVPSVAEECKFEGKQYILPLFTDGHLVFYRKDLLNIETSTINPLDLPAILDDVRKAGQITPMALKAHASEILLDFLPYLWANGGQIWDEETKTPLFDQPEAVKALEFYCSLKSLCPKDTHTYGNEEISDVLKQGKVALATSWGGQAALILDENNPYREQYCVALFDTPWNATWGITIPANQPEAVKAGLLSVLFEAASPEQDREVTRIAGAPVRKSSYTAVEREKYSWLAAQEEMLNRCQILPTDPAFSKYLGPLYGAVYQAFTGELSPQDALSAAVKTN